MIYTLFWRFEVNVFDLWLLVSINKQSRNYKMILRSTQLNFYHSIVKEFFGWVDVRPELNITDKKYSPRMDGLNETSSKINLLFSLFDVLIRSFIVIIKWMNKSRAL